MKKEIGGRQVYFSAKIWLPILILLIALLIFAGYFLFYYTKPCEDTKCFVKSIEACKKASFVKEDEKASWLYTTAKSSGSKYCIINVKLLNLKQGLIDSENLQGKEMNCNVSRSDSEYPENKIEQCTGPLKEEMQNIIIQRMHEYLLKNIGEIKQEFSKI
jgi:hypothetical protein